MTTYHKNLKLLVIHDKLQSWTTLVDDIEYSKKYIQPDWKILDIGCGDGIFSLSICDTCSKVYAYDSDIKHLSHLRLSSELNGKHNIVILTELKLHELEDIQFIRIFMPQILPITFQLLPNLQRLNHPSMLLYNLDHITKQVLQLMGYNIININNNVCYVMHKQSNISQVGERIKSLDKHLEIALWSNDTWNQVMHCIKLLPWKQEYFLNCPMMSDKVPNNPAIIKTFDGYLCNIRCSNYEYEPNFKFLDGGQVHRSDHHLLSLNRDFLITKTVVLKDETNNLYYPSFVEGVDDLRLIDESRFICSHGNLNSKRMIQQCIGTINNGKIVKLIALKGPISQRHEKNWLPFIDDDQCLYIIYLVQPFILYKVNEDTGDLILVKNQPLTTSYYQDFRGSAPPIRYNDGWLCTVHQVNQMRYIHRFVWFDKNFESIKVSIPFYFNTKGVEFNVGLCIDHQGDLVIPYSIRDNHSRIGILCKSVVNNMLEH